MKRLIIDTATKILYLALVDGETLVKEIRLKGEKDHSKNIMIKIQDLLKEVGISNIDEIIVGIGPGSYTGVRIGVTVAKMLAWTKNIKLRSVSSLYLISSGYRSAAPYIDARRGNVFCSCFINGEEILSDDLRSFYDFNKTIYLKYPEATFVTEENFNPSVREIIEHSSLVSNIFSLAPNYLRETEAERNLKNDHTKDGK